MLHPTSDVNTVQPSLQSWKGKLKETDLDFENLFIPHELFTSKYKRLLSMHHQWEASAFSVLILLLVHIGCPQPSAS